MDLRNNNYVHNELNNIKYSTEIDDIVYTGLEILDIDNVKVNILLLNSNSNMYAYVEEIKYNEYNIYIKNTFDFDIFVLTISHELYHIKEYNENKLAILTFPFGKLFYYDNKIYDPNKIDYYFRPWEINAFLFEEELKNKILDKLY